MKRRELLHPCGLLVVSLLLGGCATAEAEQRMARGDAGQPRPPRSAVVGAVAAGSGTSASPASGPVAPR